MPTKTDFDTVNDAIGELFYSYMNDIGIGQAWPGYGTTHAEILAAHGWAGPEYDEALRVFAGIDGDSFPNL